VSFVLRDGGLGVTCDRCGKEATAVPLPTVTAQLDIVRRQAREAARACGFMLLSRDWCRECASLLEGESG
jgi:hypothetical protein